jgi:hypothetical protein
VKTHELVAHQTSLGAKVAAYVGDDRTDEEAFRSEAVRFPIRIGGAADTAARFCLEEQGEVDELLRRILAARARSDGRTGGWEGLVRAVDPLGSGDPGGR